LHSKNLTARGVDANLFGIFRSRLRDVHGPEAMCSALAFIFVARYARPHPNCREGNDQNR
jgi:hypothetical protein